MKTDDVHEHHSIFTGQDQMPAMLQHIMLHEMLAPGLFALLLIQLSANEPAKAEEDPNTNIQATTLGDPDGASGSWLPGSSLAQL